MGTRQISPGFRPEVRRTLELLSPWLLNDNRALQHTPGYVNHALAKP